MLSYQLLFAFAVAFRADAAFTGSFEGILWQGGFEGQREYSEKVGKGTKSITGAIGGLTPRCGNKFAHFSIDGSDVAHNHNRAEIGFHPAEQLKEEQEGQVRYYGWSMAHDKDNPLSTDSHYELAYWELKWEWRQTIGFHIKDGRTLKLRTRVPYGSDTDVGSMAFEPGKWHDFVMGIKWSEKADQGWVQLWKDGKEVVPRTAHRTKTNNAVFSHLGIFRIPKVDTVAVMYYDCVVYAKGYDPSGTKGCYNDAKEMGPCPAPPPPPASPTKPPAPAPAPAGRRRQSSRRRFSRRRSKSRRRGGSKSRRRSKGRRRSSGRRRKR